MIDDRLLELLCCPVSRLPLRGARPEEVGRINAVLARKPGGGGIRGVEDALVSEDGRRGYLVVDGIPLLVPEEAIEIG